ncbi:MULTISPECIES: phage major capsid protein [unclassified Micromonospora]|uniref:phage major capsid protein n=1 Tax=unclassified Micromonospora TaxID=2617518 RepID=UPI002FEF9CD2
MPEKSPRQRLSRHPRERARDVWSPSDVHGAKQERARLTDKAREILRTAENAGGRNLTADESREFDNLIDRADELAEWIGEQEAARERDRDPNRPMGENDGPDRAAGGWVRTNDMLPAAVEPGKRFADHPVVRAHAQAREAADRHVMDAHGDLGNLVRAITTSSGSAVVPTEWVGEIIDRARNMAAVLRAGARIVPMDAKQVQIGRLTGDPTAAFRAEGSTITASDPTFDNVTLDSKTMSALVVGSMEWFQDSPNSRQVVAMAIAKAIALQLDLVGLYGSITTGAGAINLPTPPNPRGVLGTLNAVLSGNVLGSGAANGTTQTALSYWNEVLDTIFTVRDRNEEPNAGIWASKLARQYAKAYDSTGQPLAVPNEVDKLDWFTTNQVPSYTQGTMTTATDLFVGDWSQLLIGQRLNLTIQALTERYAESGQIGILAHWRGDVQVARPGAFAVHKALKGA